MKMSTKKREVRKVDRYDQSCIELIEMEGDTSQDDAMACVAELKIPGGVSVTPEDLVSIIKADIDPGHSVENLRVERIYTYHGTDVTVTFQSYPTTPGQKKATLELIAEGHIMRREITPTLFKLLGKDPVCKALAEYQRRMRVVRCANGKSMAESGTKPHIRMEGETENWCVPCKVRPDSVKYCSVVQGLLQDAKRGSLIEEVLPGLTVEDIKDLKEV